MTLLRKHPSVQGWRRRAPATDGAGTSARTFLRVSLSSTACKQGEGRKNHCCLEGSGRNPLHLGAGNSIKSVLGGMLGPEPQLDKGQGHSEGHIPETQGHSDCLRWMLNQNNKLPVLVSCPQRGRHQVTVDSAGRRVRPCQQTLCELQPKGKTRSRADSRQ